VPDGIDLLLLAERVSYVGSPEHKAGLSFAGRPAPRADASKCLNSIKKEQAQTWLREGVKSGICGGLWEGDFPRYVWRIIDEQRYEARLINRTLGQYKGYPILEEEWPEGGTTDE
jgi:hypothetical protein